MDVVLIRVLDEALVDWTQGMHAALRQGRFDADASPVYNSQYVEAGRWLARVVPMLKPVDWDVSECLYLLTLCAHGLPGLLYLED
jgi:hypothetical protein